MKYEGWEPEVEGNGVVLSFHDLPPVVIETHDMIEVRDDIAEAIHDQRGYRAVDCMVCELIPGDLIYVLGNHYEVTNLLSSTITRSTETEWIVQFTNHAYTEVQTEVTLPGDQQVTAYRRPDVAADNM